MEGGAIAGGTKDGKEEVGWRAWMVEGWLGAVEVVGARDPMEEGAAPMD